MTSNEIYIKNRSDLRNWLYKNYSQKEGIWLVFEKGKNRTIDISEIVEELLCFGWIDSKAGSISDTQTKLYVAPRKAKSNWSALNKSRVKLLIDKGFMEEPGLKMIELAKQTGTWDALNDVENLVIPKDLEAEFKKYKDAKVNFNAFSKSSQKMILQWLLSAKRPETRKARIEKTAEMAGRNEKAFG
ncbi:MAG: hypothetical protein AMXMBFR12_10830 [Candidatus Babeliales bacterium]